MNEFLLDPEGAELPEPAEQAEQPTENELLSQQYMDGLSKSLEEGDADTARFYLGKLSELYGLQEGAEEDAPESAQAESDELGEAQQPEMTFGSSERDTLERELRNARDKYHNSSKQLGILLRDKARGMIGVDPGISDRKYQVKVYSKEICDLERQLSRLKD